MACLFLLADDSGFPFFFFKSSAFSSSQISYIYLSSTILIFAQIIDLFLTEFIRLSDLFILLIAV